MNIYIIICITVLITLSDSKKQKQGEKPAWAKKDIRDYNDADMERLFDQWEMETNFKIRQRKKCVPPTNQPVFDVKRKHVKQALKRITKNVSKVRNECKKPRGVCFEPYAIHPSSPVYIAAELRKSVATHNWRNAIRLLLLLLHKPKRYEPVIWRMCLLVVLNHPNSTKELQEDFIKMTTGVHDPERVLQNVTKLCQQLNNKDAGKQDSPDDDVHSD